LGFRLQFRQTPMAFSAAFAGMNAEYLSADVAIAA
jgi:hypothetical protein